MVAQHLLHDLGAHALREQHTCQTMAQGVEMDAWEACLLGPRVKRLPKLSGRQRSSRPGAAVMTGRSAQGVLEAPRRSFA